MRDRLPNSNWIYATMNHIEFPAVYQFLSGYFNQDYSLDFGSPDEVVNSFLTDEPREVIDALSKELDRFIPLVHGSNDPDALLAEFDCYYTPLPHGQSVGGWLEKIQAQLRNWHNLRDSHD